MSPAPAAETTSGVVQVTIHQPSCEIFEAFDLLVLLQVSMPCVSTDAIIRSCVAWSRGACPWRAAIPTTHTSPITSPYRQPLPLRPSAAGRPADLLWAAGPGELSADCLPPGLPRGGPNPPRLQPSHMVRRLQLPFLQSIPLTPLCSFPFDALPAARHAALWSAFNLPLAAGVGVQPLPPCTPD